MEKVLDTDIDEVLAFFNECDVEQLDDIDFKIDEVRDCQNTLFFFL